MDALDHRKYEAIQLTFKQVSAVVIKIDIPTKKVQVCIEM
jgi:hypothetical protein